MKSLILSAFALVLAMPAHAEIKTRTVEYKDGATTLEGYAAWDPATKGKRPLVLVFHEWWGHGPYVRKRAEQLAGLGYVAFAVDMYGKGVRAKDHAEASKLAGAQFEDRALMRRRAKAGLDAGLALSDVDPGRVAAIGYCFGGGAVLELARMGADLKAVVSFHGALATSQPAKDKPKAKILVQHGGSDAMINPQLPGFMDEMRKVDADWELAVYGRAVHSFTVPEAGNDPKKGMAYDADADAKSWARMRAFLDEALR